VASFIKNELINVFNT